MNVEIIVANKKHGARGEYVGRPSILGNPFVIGRDGDRAEVIRKYEVWLSRQACARDPRVYGELERLAALARERGTLTLVCFCAPLPCHAEIIREILLTMVASPTR